MTREQAIQILSTRDWSGMLCGYTSGYTEALDMAIEALQAKDLQGEWIQKPHKVYLSRDYEPDIIDYHNHQYNEEDHSIIEYWWHCNQCDYEADRWSKPTFKFCPSCGADMRQEK